MSIFENIVNNRPISNKLSEKAGALLYKNETPIIAVSCDMQLKAAYGKSALIITDSRLICVEETAQNEGFFIDLDKIEDIGVRRMYGNAVLFVNNKMVLRFSFSDVAAVEAAAQYIKDINASIVPSDAINQVEKAFLKQHLFCPKCGRSLIHAGAECINCQGKKKLLKRMWDYLSPQKVRLLVCLLISAITTAMALIPPYITKMLVDDVIPKSNLKLLFSLVGVLLVVHFLQAVLGTFRARQMRLAGDIIVTNLRNDVYAKTQYLKIGFYDKTGTGSIFSRINGDTTNLNNFLLRISQEAIVQFFLMIGIVVIMFALNFKLALLSLLPIPIVVIGSRIFRKKIMPIHHKLWLRWAKVCDYISDALPGIRVTKAFTGEQDSINKFESLNDNWFQDSKRSALVGSIYPHAVTFFVTCGSLAIWGVGGSWAIANSDLMSAGMLVSFISYASMFYGPVNFFANLSDGYSHALTSAERLLDILDAETEDDHGKGNIIEDVKGRIEFKNVSFSFDKTVKTLDDINLTIEPGDIVGIVGTTGAGKTTLINLIMRYYDKYDGEILVDGKNIKNIDLKDYRSHIGFVQQEPIMFRDTIYKNIALSDKNIAPEEVFRAAEVANAHNFITHLPDSYDTVLGERGIGLSGGERQRLSIARAVIKNPSILIFDEATASVDSETEHLIQEAIERLISGRTTLMIAHRLSTLRRANKIVVMEKGKIIEVGTHDELLAKKGKYHRLVEIQNLSEEIRRKESNEEERTEIDR